MRQWNRLLWVMNNAWIGGSPLWVRDALRSMPLWQHEVVYVNGHEDPSVAEKFRDAGASLSHADRLTRSLVDTIDPAAVILSNTNPAFIEGEHPWSWLTSMRTVISVHHTAVRPWIPGAAMDVFVSRYLYARYEGLAPRMNRIRILSPGIDVDPFLSIPRPAAGSRCVIGRHSSDHPDKFPAAIPEILRAVGQPARVVGGAKYYPAANDIDFPNIGSTDVPEFLASIDAFFYRTALVETWCRAVSEAMASGLPCVVQNEGGIPEQIEDGVDGFLCNDDRDFVDRLQLLARSPALRAEMGQRARLKAVHSFRADSFRAEVEELIVRAVMETRGG